MPSTTSLSPLGRAALLAAVAFSLFSASAFSAPNSAPRDAGLLRTASSAPSQAQVENAVRDGDYAQAESMLREVVRAKPTSAKAWYWMAQAQEKQGKSGPARQSLAKAEQLDPSLKFASPGAVESMRARLGSRPSRSASRSDNSGDRPVAVPGYEGRPAVGSESGASSKRLPVNLPAEPAPSHAWIYVLAGVLILFGATAYLLSKKAKAQAQDESERDRKALLARANSIQERASSMVQTARFESQESSSFGVGAAGALSKANSALSRLKTSFAKINPGQERSALDELEARVEALESQGARKAWNDQEPESAAPSPSEESFGRPSPNGSGPRWAPSSASGPLGQANPAAPIGSSVGTPSQTSGFGGSPYSNGSSPSAPVIIQQGSSGSGLFETLAIASMLDGGRPRHEYENRDDSRRAARDEPLRSGPAPADSSSFDLGGTGSGSSWDSPSSPKEDPEPSFDSGSSSDSSSSFDSGSSSDSSSSFDSGSSSDSSSSFDSDSSSSSSSSDDSSSNW